MRDILLTIIIFGLLPFCLIRPWVGVLMWTWIGLMNPHRMTYGFAYDMPFAQLVAIATLVGLLFTQDKRRIPQDPGLIMCGLLFAYFTATTPLAWATEAAWTQWEKVAKILLMVFVIPMLIYGRARIRALLLTIALSIGFYGVKGGIFTLTTGGINRVQGPRGGTFISSNTDLGLALLMVVPLLVFLAREETRTWLRRSLYAAAGLSMISVVFTYSRGALLGLGATAPMLFMRSKKKFLILLALVPLAIFGESLIPQELADRTATIQSYEQDQSSMLRIQSWGVAYNIARERPLTGAGFNFEHASDAQWLSYAPFLVAPNHPGVDRARAAHSIYFQMLGQHGFVALGLFVLLIATTLIRLQRLKSQAEKNPETTWLSNYAAGLQIALVGYTVSGTFLSACYFDLFYVYIAIAAVLHREMAAASSAVATPAGAPDSHPSHAQIAYAADRPSTPLR